MIEALIRAAATKLIVDRTRATLGPHDHVWHAAATVAFPHVWHLAAKGLGWRV